MAKKKYPECDKLSACHEDSQRIGNFLEWLEHQGLRICECVPQGKFDSYYAPIFKRSDQIIAEYHDIDLEKIELERRKMLDEIRESNKNKV